MTTEVSALDSTSQQDMQQLKQTIAQRMARLDAVNTELEAIEEQNRNDDSNRQVQEYLETAPAPHDIAAEDAMDHIVRLQNQLNIVRRRNQLLARENAQQQGQLRDRTKKLHASSKELEKVMTATGWYGGKREVQFSQIERERADIDDMALVDASLRSDIKNAKIAIAKLEREVLSLSAKDDANEERRSQYMKLRNDLHAREKECKEMQAMTQRMAEDNQKMQLVVQAECETAVGESSIAYMENDRNFLSEAMQDMKMTCRRQDNIIKAQMARQQQLQHRLDMVNKSLKEMRLSREFDRSAAKSALVPSASREEPHDVAEVLPEEEYIPVETYRLLYKNNEMVRTNVARKNMLVLEKESTVQSVEGKLARHIEMHNELARMDDNMHMSTAASARATQHTFKAEEKGLVQEIDELRASNAQLRASIAKKTPTGSYRRSQPTNGKK